MAMMSLQLSFVQTRKRVSMAMPRLLKLTCMSSKSLSWMNLVVAIIQRQRRNQMESDMVTTVLRRGCHGKARRHCGVLRLKTQCHEHGFSLAAIDQSSELDRIFVVEAEIAENLDSQNAEYEKEQEEKRGEMSDRRQGLQERAHETF
jgi:hypothetical protein